MRWLAGAAALALLFYLARPVIPPFIVGALVAYILGPVVDRLQRRSRLPRVAIIAGLYVVLLGGLGFGIWIVESQLAREIRQLSAEGPDLVDTAFMRLIGMRSFQFFGQEADPHRLAIWVNHRLEDVIGDPGDALHVAERALDSVLKTFLTLVVVFYLLLD